jgi:ADP-dependent NAD(P)H-hydrate dehydratase / NAD(P)H-hydrate epimerase
VIASARPELICHGVEDARALAPLLAAADVIALGPGLGRSAWGRSLAMAAFATAAPLVVDADALNILAAEPRARHDWCLTPHPGEAARLLGCEVAAVQADRLGTVRALIARFGASVVLKGAGSLIGSAAGPPWVCERGNPGMAVAGMGDVLTGVIAALAAQQPEPRVALAQAAAVAAYVHASAGDLAARAGERGILASDLLALLPACVNPAP